ncbi:MAG TPA: hypothetical protein DCK93_06525 [Blastocatellia bacterium]|nr:hypothetical protein [Blastocatellia bacterium]HAF22557.1 hypothetical protein [Blastocatellia bacterium]
MCGPAGCDHTQRDTQHVDEAVLSAKDHISERVVGTVLFLSDHWALPTVVERSTHRSPEASCNRLLLHDGIGASTLEAFEREHILHALRETGWVVAGAAERLGLNRSTLNARMRKLEIIRPQPV